MYLIVVCQSTIHLYYIISVIPFQVLSVYTLHVLYFTLYRFYLTFFLLQVVVFPSGNANLVLPIITFPKKGAAKTVGRTSRQILTIDQIKSMHLLTQVK